MTSKTFEDVGVWKQAHEFVLRAYKFSEGFPRHELYGLTSQFRRAAVSIPANFAEGFRKTSIADKIRFYNIAQGSIEECRYYLILSRDLGYGEVAELRRNLEAVSKMLSAYIDGIRRRG
jgi:four helix bundle protein